MAHTDEEIDAASRRFEQLVNDFDPAAAVVDNIDELSQVAAASEAVCRAPVGRDHFGGVAPPGMDHPCAS